MKAIKTCDITAKFTDAKNILLQVELTLQNQLELIEPKQSSLTFSNFKFFAPKFLSQFFFVYDRERFLDPKADVSVLLNDHWNLP